MDKARADPDFHLFLLTLALEWVETKHGVKLHRDKLSYPKMRSKGRLMVHVIKRTKRPLIARLDVDAVPVVAASDHRNKLQVPKYTITTEPGELEEGRAPDYLVVEVDLPKVASIVADGRDICSLDLEAQRLLLHCPDVYAPLDLTLSWPIELDEGGAQFDRDTRRLTVTLTVSSCT
jgi:hypothetical protein